jgi:phosphoribosylformylglycinamidine synthase I
MKPRALIVHATGTNRDLDVAFALELAGAEPEIVHMNALRDGEKRMRDYQLLVLPGGFSYGDDLGAGKLWAVALRHRLGEQLHLFVASGRPVIGICNGFQALVKSGLLPALNGATSQRATLTRNESARFECRWVELEPNPRSTSLWLNGVSDPIFCPVAHGEGRFVTDDTTLETIEQQHLVGLRYVVPADGDAYPANPNGSLHNIAGITNPTGNILGLMPHPENHVVPEQHPNRHRRITRGSALTLFKNGVKHAANQ